MSPWYRSTLTRRAWPRVRDAREAGTSETVISAAKSRAKSDTATPYVTSLRGGIRGIQDGRVRLSVT